MCTLGTFTTIGFAPPVHWFAPQGGSAGAAPGIMNSSRLVCVIRIGDEPGGGRGARI